MHKTRFALVKEVGSVQMGCFAESQVKGLSFFILYVDNLGKHKSLL